MSHKCPNCHSTLNHDARFCTRCGTAVTYPAGAGDTLVGRELDGKYKLLARLGAGGMGAVYRALRLHIGDEVAVKLLHAQYVSDKTMVERFRREARAAATLHHQNIVGIYDFSGVTGEDSPAYIVMELVAGESLREIIQQSGPLEPERALALMREICAGVGAAHRHNIVHRDLKPDNIIVSPAQWEDEREVVKVVDFGIARLRDAASSNLTQTGVVIGTPYYMAPEQCRGEHAETPADVYSLGAILYEMLAGTPPFVAPTPTGVIVKHLTEPPPPLPATLKIGPALEAVIMRALEKEPAARQPNANTLARELNAAFAAAPAAPAATPVVSTPSQASAQVTPPVSERVEPTPAPPAAEVVQDAAPRPQHTPPPQAQSSTPPAPPHGASPASSRRLVFVLAGLLLTLAVGVAVGALMSNRGGGGAGNSSNQTAPVAGAPSTIPTPASLASQQQGGTKVDDQTAGGTTRPAQTPAANPPVTTQTPPSTQPPASNRPPAPGQTKDTNVAPAAGPPGNFFVILGSFRKADEQAKAQARLALLRGKGYDARIVDSDNYPRLAGGLLVVVMGPYARPYANRLASELRGVAPEGAYVKAGR